MKAVSPLHLQKFQPYLTSLARSWCRMRAQRPRISEPLLIARWEKWHGGRARNPEKGAYHDRDRGFSQRCL